MRFRSRAASRRHSRLPVKRKTLPPECGNKVIVGSGKPGYAARQGLSGVLGRLVQALLW